MRNNIPSPLPVTITKGSEYDRSRPNPPAMPPGGMNIPDPAIEEARKAIAAAAKLEIPLSALATANHEIFFSAAEMGGFRKPSHVDYARVFNWVLDIVGNKSTLPIVNTKARVHLAAAKRSGISISFLLDNGPGTFFSVTRSLGVSLPEGEEAVTIFAEVVQMVGATKPDQD